MVRSVMIKSKIESLIGKKVVIVCCGKLGKNVLNCLGEYDIEPVCFFDNSIKFIGTRVSGIAVEAVSNKGAGYKYIIANDDVVVRRDLKEQLNGVGIELSSIIEISNDDAWLYWKNLPETRYQEEISQLYYEAFGRQMDWSNPQLYNEIINYEKVNADDNEKKHFLADKYRAREYVAKIIGEEHLVKYLGVWNSGEEIDFDSLPQSFVLKTNNGSGRNILVKNKDDIIIDDVVLTLNHWLSMDYGYQSLATNYMGIAPKIVCEEYLDGLAETVYDYDVFCFHGEPRYICCIKGSHRKESFSAYYDTSWNRQPFEYGWPGGLKEVPRPTQLDQILNFSRKLSKGFRHVRVDWYIMNDGRVLFSEMTFATWGGLKKFIPEEWDEKFGKMIIGER